MLFLTTFEFPILRFDLLNIFIIEAPKSPGQFYIDEFTGKIYLRHLLDYETAPYHSVDLQILDENQSPQRSATFNINITVHNINEHPPVS